MAITGQSVEINAKVNDSQAKATLTNLERHVYEFKRTAEEPVTVRVDSKEIKDANGELKKYSETYKQANGVVEQYALSVDKAGKAVLTEVKSEKDAADAIERRMQNLDAYMKLRDKTAEANKKAAEKEAQAEARLMGQLDSAWERVQARESAFSRVSSDVLDRYSLGLMSAAEANATLEKETTDSGNAAQESGKKIKESGKETEEAGKKAEKSSKAFGLLHTVFLRLAHTAISAVTRSFREALTEMKNVDSELVVVRKVSNASAEELEKLRDRAYEVGAAYGVAASDYLNAAAEMTRAGYREQAGDLAELATKLQLVGDVSQETANQFLIATDKAYKMNGDMKKLSDTIDKLNEIDNNYATSIQKVADGIGILAPIASQTHVSFEQMAAALGTITAVTQRSGSESARALRSLFLNIAKDTSTEIEEGVTWTVDEINNLHDALKKYAPEVVRAAEASGKLINPMEAIGALAKSFEEGILDEQKLMEIVSGLGGKLRSSQLLALIQNWDMYNDMLKTTAEAAGSADREVQNALDAWDKKLQQLKNTFTQFTTTILDSDEIKGFIDAANMFLKSIDNPEEYSAKFEEALEKSIQGLVEKLPRIQKVINYVSIELAKSFISAIKDNIVEGLRSLADGSSQATAALKKELPEVVENIFTIVGEVATQAMLDSDLAYNLTVSLVEGIIAAIPRIFTGGITGIFNALDQSMAGDTFGEVLTNWATSKLAKKQGVLGKAGRWLFNKIAGEDIYNLDGGFNVEPIVEGNEEVVESEKDVADAIEETTDAFGGQTDAIKETTSALDKYKEALKGGEKGDDLKSYAEAFKSAVEMYDKGLTGTTAYMSAVDLLFGSGIAKTYEEAGKLLGNEFIKAMFEGGGEDFGANAANYIREHLDQFKGVAIEEADDGSFSLLVSDMEEFAKSANLSVGSMQALMDALDGYDSSTLEGVIRAVGDFSDEEHPIDVPVGDEEQADQFFDHVEERIDELDGRKINITVQGHWGQDAVGGSGGGGVVHGQYYASGTDNATGGMALVNERGAEIITDGNSAWISGGGKPTITYLPNGATVYNAEETRDIFSRSGIPSFKNGVSEFTDTGGSGGARKTTETVGKDLTLYRWKASHIKRKDDGANSGAGSGSGSSNSSDDLLSELDKYIDKLLKKAKTALDKQLDLIDAEIDALKREHDADEDRNKLEELREKILDAEKKLLDATNERTVRYFNSETGQWEWMADQKAVAEAEKALKEATENYDKEVADQAYEAQLQELKDEKDRLKSEYDALADQWDSLYEEIKETSEEQTDFDKLMSLIGLGSDKTTSIQSLVSAIAAYESGVGSNQYGVPLDEATAIRLLGAYGSGLGGTYSMMYGLSSSDANARAQSIYSTTTSSVVGDTVVYINGVQIGSDMMNRPLSEILSRLSIYAN